jgi:hypothetical protein
LYIATLPTAEAELIATIRRICFHFMIYRFEFYLNYRFKLYALREQNNYMSGFFILPLGQFNIKFTKVLVDH